MRRGLILAVVLAGCSHPAPLPVPPEPPEMPPAAPAAVPHVSESTRLLAEFRAAERAAMAYAARPDADPSVVEELRVILAEAWRAVHHRKPAAARAAVAEVKKRAAPIAEGN